MIAVAAAAAVAVLVVVVGVNASSGYSSNSRSQKWWQEMMSRMLPYKVPSSMFLSFPRATFQATNV